MKEIKFRIWDKELKESHIEKLQDLCEDDYWYDGETEVWSVLYDCNNKQERFIAMQFTGIHDKNGKEIYEGDIISNGYEKCIVVWVKKYAGFMLKLINKEYEDKEWTNPMIDLRNDEEVIGNIYENPELLKGADNIE